MTGVNGQNEATSDNAWEFTPQVPPPYSSIIVCNTRMQLKNKYMIKKNTHRLFQLPLLQKPAHPPTHTAEQMDRSRETQGMSVRLCVRVRVRDPFVPLH